VILYCNYEELTALLAGARTYLDRDEPGGGGVLAPSEERVHVEAFVDLLEGDISLSTLAEVRDAQSGLFAIVECLRLEMEYGIVTTHPAHEGAVAAYFDFAHGFTVARRLDQMANEMSALIELVTGEPPTADTARSFQFPD